MASATSAAKAMTRVIDRDAAKVNSPCSKTNAGYLKKNWISASITSRPFYLEGAATHRVKFGRRARPASRRFTSEVS